MYNLSFFIHIIIYTFDIEWTHVLGVIINMEDIVTHFSSASEAGKDCHDIISPCTDSGWVFIITCKITVDGQCTVNKYKSK